MPNMLKKISVHSSKATAGAIAESADVTLVSDDNSAVSANNEEMQHLEAHLCADCEDNCEGFILETVDNCVTPASDDQQPIDDTSCNCTGSLGPCPLDGDFRKEKNVIVICYTGLTAKTFKVRYNGHNTTFNNIEAKQTTLSRHNWSLKDTFY